MALATLGFEIPASEIAKCIGLDADEVIIRSHAPILASAASLRA
jgi:hypothetical protein